MYRILMKKSPLFLLLIFLNVMLDSLPAQLITLPEAVKIALENNPRIKQYSENFKQKKLAENEAFGNFLPGISIQGSYNHLNTAMEIDLNPIREAIILMQTANQVEFSNIYNSLQYSLPLTPEQRIALQGQYKAQLENKIPPFELQFKERNFYTASITGIQPIFFGGRLIAAKNFATAEKLASAAENKKVKNEIMKEVIQRYLNIVLSQQVVNTRQDVLAGMKRHQADAHRLFQEGLIAQHHLLRADVAVAEAERNLFDDENRLELAKIAFQQSLGITKCDGIQIIDSLIYKPVTISLDSFLVCANNSQPMLTWISQKKKAASQKYMAERADYLPQIAGFGKYELFPEYLSAIEPRWVVGIQANMSLFDGFKRYQQIQSARHLKKEAEYAEMDAKSQINLWVNKAYREMRNAETRYQKLETSIRLAKENVKVNEKRFSSGLGTSLEVIDARLVLEKNQIEQSKSLYDYYQALAELYEASGHPEEIVILWQN